MKMEIRYTHRNFVGGTKLIADKMPRAAQTRLPPFLKISCAGSNPTVSVICRVRTQNSYQSSKKRVYLRNDRESSEGAAPADVLVCYMGSIPGSVLEIKNGALP